MTQTFIQQLSVDTLTCWPLLNKPRALPLSLVGSRGSGHMDKQTAAVSEISAIIRESQNATGTHKRHPPGRRGSQAETEEGPRKQQHPAQSACETRQHALPQVFKSLPKSCDYRKAEITCPWSSLLSR